MIRLTRRYRFSASHRLHTPALTDRENAEVYGKCNNPLGHGHNYVLEVSVLGALDQRTGRVVDIAALDKLVEERILSHVRHKNLNTEAAELAGPVPTTESLARGIRSALNQSWRGAFLQGTPRMDRVRVHETQKNIFEVPAST